MGNRVHTVKEGLTECEAGRLTGRPDLLECDDWQGEGVFCSDECAYAYCLAFYKPEYKDFLMLWQDRWRRTHGGTDPPSLVPAPHYTLLRRYGGLLTLGQFREALGTLRVDDATAMHCPFGGVLRSQRVYSVRHVTPAAHALRQSAGRRRAQQALDRAATPPASTDATDPPPAPAAVAEIPSPPLPPVAPPLPRSGDRAPKRARIAAPT